MAQEKDIGKFFKSFWSVPTYTQDAKEQEKIKPKVRWRGCCSREKPLSTVREDFLQERGRDECN